VQEASSIARGLAAGRGTMSAAARGRSPPARRVLRQAMRVPQFRRSGRARQAGFALRVAPKALNLPWHRVVAAGGRIAFPSSSREYREQARRLRAEGVRVAEGRVERGALTELA
jgi:hypothetical protein